MSKVTILGIRHHGVGSAKNVLEMLENLQPDLLLVEGPPEMEAIQHWIGHKKLKPPVAALCYDEVSPLRSVFYPFSVYSPEWQAIAYANAQKIPVRMMDLPVSLSWQLSDQTENEQLETSDKLPPGDPIAYFAQIAGYESAEMWWEHHFEHNYIKGAASTHFEAVLLMMKTLRDAGVSTHLDQINQYREAWMAQTIRKAQNELYQNIVVVCGAWHAPALLELHQTEKSHSRILKALPKSKIKIGATWIPWTNDRLSYESGYGAGITSPGWYKHIWKHPQDRGARWLTKVAQLFRKKKMDISTAHVIEALRLAESLAALRGRPRAGLQEFNEATTTVMCMGDHILLDYVREHLIIGQALGSVPKELPKLPLQADFEENIRHLRLSQTADAKELSLDLRKELDLKRSVFLHRLQLLGISWAVLSSANSKGTFRENWTLRWNPEMMLSLIEMGIWGNTISTASNQWLAHKVAQTDSVAALSAMMTEAIPAELFEVIEALLHKINQVATVSADVSELMAALVPLADLGRYGNVRRSDMEAVAVLVEGLVIRISIGLPAACYGLDEETAQNMFNLMRKVNEAVRTLAHASLSQFWFQSLQKMSDHDSIPAILRGCTHRLLLDASITDHAQAAQAFGLALSTGNEVVDAAAWLEGFLKGSGMILLYDETLWNILYAWVETLEETAFIQLLPILRRTFVKFSPGERKKLGEKAKYGIQIQQQSGDVYIQTSFNVELAESAMRAVAGWMPLKTPAKP